MTYIKAAMISAATIAGPWILYQMWLFVAAGRVVKVEADSLGDDAVTAMMTVLDWHLGSFEFIACEVAGTDELGMPTSQILLEHARLRDEARRPVVVD